MTRTYRFILLPLLSLLLCSCSSAGSDIELGEEYSDHNKPVQISNLPEEVYVDSEPASLPFRVTGYVVDRFADLLDVVKIDAGIGPAWGLVTKVTKYGQVGFRNMNPASLRVGLRGRDWPIFLERVNEFGIGPSYLGSPSRVVSPVELGAGVDLFLVGGYIGLSLDGLLDFLLGFGGIDISDDDGILYK